MKLSQVIIKGNLRKDSNVVNETLDMREICKQGVHDRLKEIWTVGDSHRQSLIFEEPKGGANDTQFL